MDRRNLPHTPEHRRKISEAKTGVHKSNGLLGRPKPVEVREKISKTLTAKHAVLFPFGIKANRRRAKERDNYTCQICGLADKEVLEVDHIIPKFIRPDLKSELSNMLTLCANCHKRKTNRDKKQIWALKQERKSLQEIESEYYQLK